MVNIPALRRVGFNDNSVHEAPTLTGGVECPDEAVSHLRSVLSTRRSQLP
jgi:hypothetical protein